MYRSLSLPTWDYAVRTIQKCSLDNMTMSQYTIYGQKLYYKSPSQTTMEYFFRSISLHSSSQRIGFSGLWQRVSLPERKEREIH